MEGGYNLPYPKQAKTNSGNNNATAAAAAAATLIENVSVPNEVENHLGKQPVDSLPPESVDLREQDMYMHMPIANVIRIMRKILPPHAKISEDAKETLQECVSEYISFLTSEANAHCKLEERKTITAEDLIWAMGELGFDDYCALITRFMERYRESKNEPSSSQQQPNNRRRGADEVAEYEPLGMDNAGPIGPLNPIGPTAHNLNPPQGHFYDPSMMNANNFRCNNSDSAGASSSQANLPGFNPYSYSQHK